MEEETRGEMDQDYWQQQFLRKIRLGLEQVSNRIRVNGPASVRSRMGSLLPLLSYAQTQPEMYGRILDLIDLLHPWPLRWEYWPAWEEELRFSVNICQQMGDTTRQARFLAELADLLMTCGRIEEAEEMAASSYHFARLLPAPQLRTIGLAGKVLIQAHRSTGRTESANQLLKTINQELVKDAGSDETTTVSSSDLAIARAQLLNHNLHLFWKNRQTAEAFQLAEEVLNALQAIPSLTDHTVIADVLRARGILCWRLHNYAQAIFDFQRAVEVLESTGNMLDATITRGELGVVYYFAGNYALAEQAQWERIRLCQRLNARRELLYAYGEMTAIYLSTCKASEAILYINRQYELALAMANPAFTAVAQNNRAAINLYIKHDYQAALPELEAAVHLHDQQGFHSAAASARIDLAVCLRGLGEIERARRLAEQAYQAVTTPAFPEYLPLLEVSVLRGWALFVSPLEAQTLLEKALSLAQQYHSQINEAACLISLSGLTETLTQKRKLWRQGKNILAHIGALAWLEGYSLKSPPLIVIIY